MRKLLTEEQIAAKCEDKDGMANRRAINALYRKQDQSHLAPISGRFDTTERAIRRLRRQGYDGYGLEYAYALSGEISEIVNSVYR